MGEGGRGEEEDCRTAGVRGNPVLLRPSPRSLASAPNLETFRGFS